MTVTPSFKVDIAGTEHVLTKEQAEALRDALNKALEVPVKVTITPSVDDLLERLRIGTGRLSPDVYWPQYNPPPPHWRQPITCAVL